MRTGCSQTGITSLANQWLAISTDKNTTEKYNFSRMWNLIFSGCINLSGGGHNDMPSGGIWRRRNGQFSFPPSPRLTPSSMRTAATTLTPSQSSALVKMDVKIMKIEADEHQLSGAKLLTTYEMHYQTDGDSFMFIKGRWVAFLLFIGQLGHLMNNWDCLVGRLT